MSKVKELYLCKNIDDLENRTRIPDTRNKAMKILLEKARQLLSKAEETYREGDEELAYIFYTRYFFILNSIYKKPDYEISKPLIREVLGNNRDNKLTMDRLEDLSKSLTKRYICLNDRASNVNSSVSNQVSSTLLKAGNHIELISCTNNNSTINNVLRSRSTSPNSPTSTSLRLLSCKDLCKYIESRSVLVMDCRSLNDYKESHLQYVSSFNVPQEYITLGMTAGKIQDKLDVESKKLWSARAVKDHIVLMDWNCSIAEPDTSSPIGVLLNILQNWDPDTVYRSTIRILDGGYEHFVQMYPMYCVNPKIQTWSPSSHSFNGVINKTTELSLIDEIEYPSIKDIQLKDDIIALSDLERNTPKPTLNDAINIKNNRTIAPKVDRGSKLAAIKIYDEKEIEISEIAKGQQMLLEKAKKNDKQLEQVAKQWKKIYNKEQLSTAEQELVYNLMQLESVAEDYKNENMLLKEALELYKREHEEKALLVTQNIEEEETKKQIEANFAERQRMDEQLERERQQRTQLAMAHKQKCQFADSISKLNNNDLIMENNIIPVFDRSTKPTQQSAQVESPTNYKNVKRDFSPVPGGAGRRLTGLKNLGNTCYMNSILQCLSNTSQLAEYCISDNYKKYVQYNNKTKGQIIEEIAALIKILWNGKFRCVSSKNLHYVVGQYQKMFCDRQQQDSHEFLTILIDWLHSDLQSIIVPEQFQQLITARDKAWLDFTKAKESFILHLFYGQIKSFVKCITCGKESATYECFSNLSLELPEDNNRCILKLCLDMYFAGERIHGWNCPNCKQKRDAIKKLNISRLPTILVIHLKRFHANTDTITPTYRKKQNYVSFPLEELDMSDYLTLSLSERKDFKNYNLYAVSNHYGSMESGHYTSFCKIDDYDHWFKYDDQTVTSLNTSNVVASAAYILFYTSLKT